MKVLKTLILGMGLLCAPSIYAEGMPSGQTCANFSSNGLNSSTAAKPNQAKRAKFSGSTRGTSLPARRAQ